MDERREPGADPAGRPDVDEILAAGLEREAHERGAWLAAIRREDGELADELAARLRALEEFGLDALPRSRGGMRVGPYALHERIGGGGMGEVWRASDGERTVAVKLVRPELLPFDGAQRRFAREAVAAGSLEHPGIVTVLDNGEDHGVPWIAFEWIAGASLEAVLERLRTRPPVALDAAAARAALAEASGLPAPPPRRESAPANYEAWCADLLAEVADALAHAHDKGILHRDVKPSNILLRADGQPVLVDFGLALPLAATRLTRSGSWLGSLPYAAPEQLAGERGLDARADVYGLGATLYECLTLRTPFLGGDESAVRTRIRRGDLAPPRTVRPNVSRGLERVCLAALDIDPRRRPASAGELRDDLRRVADERAPRARALPRWLAALRWMRRRPRAAAALAALTGIVLIALAFAGRERAFANRLRRMADAELVARLRRDAAGLWPPHPRQVEPCDTWLVAAERALERRAGHERSLAQLRAIALPYDDEQRRRDRAETLERFATLRLELEGLVHYLRTRCDLLDRPQPLSAAESERLVHECRESFARDPAAAQALFPPRIAEVRALASGDAAQGRFTLAQALEFERALARLGEEWSTRRTYDFADRFDRWRHDELVHLVGALAALEGDVERVRHLRRRSAELRAAAPRLRATWADAARAIAASPRYAGLRPPPQADLESLGEDPRSGLWLFGLLGSGALRGGEASQAAVVFVLLPGGDFAMGVPPGSVESAVAAPRHHVRLAPFYFAKEELRAGQALSFGELPAEARFQTAQLELPVVISWEAARALLVPYALDLPTEAQWEYAMTAGGAAGGWQLRAADNDFGIVGGTCGVSEWCRDWLIVRGYSTLPSRPGDGLKDSVFVGPAHVIRGGGASGTALDASPFQRVMSYSGASQAVGVRAVRALDASPLEPHGAHPAARVREQ